MALPTLETPENKGQVQEIISDIATAVFKSAKISMESAAKAVVPSVPEMVNEVLDDLKSGSIQKFNQAMEKLDKLVKVLGIDLKKYNKELANFAEKREQKIIQSEEKIQTLRENNIIAEIEKSGDINVLSQNEIEKKQKALRDAENRIKELEKKIAKDTKQIQDPGLFDKKLKTTAQFNKKEEIKKDVKELEQKKKERDQAKGVLGERGEQQPGIFQRGRERVGSFVDEYVPDPIADIGSTMVEGFMAPINAVKDLGKSFGQLLKPLKLLKPLFGGLLGSLKKFALGLKASVVAMLPQIAIIGLVILALYGLYRFIKKFFPDPNKEIKENVEERSKKQQEIGNIRQSENIKESIKEKPEFLNSRGNIIKFGEKKSVDQIEKDFQPQTEMPERFKEKILPGSYWDKIQKMDNRSGDLKKQEYREKLQMPDNLTPIEKKETGDSANISANTSQILNQNTTTTVTGVSGPRDRDMEIFYLANPLYR